jgi:chemotaxis protein MotB
MPLSRRSPVATANYWPSFVDALSALVLVLVYLISAFLLVQFFLSTVIQGKDTALEQLRREIAQLSGVLSMERAANADLRTNVGRLSASLQSETEDALQTRAERDKARNDVQLLEQALAERDEKLAELSRRADTLSQAVQEQQATRGGMESQLQTTQGQLQAAQTELEQAREQTRASRAEVDQLNQQVAALRQQLTQIAAALQVSQADVSAKETQIQELGKRLNVALLQRVEELSKYRSEFFGRLNAILGGRKDIQVVGDRFVFQSEVLFPPGSAEITPEGQEQLSALAKTVLGIAKEIPDNVPWILRVDGHTDSVPIHNERFASNWELSAARAISVVRFLIDQGVPAQRVAAAGFADNQPLEPEKPGAGDAKNRRIEIKLTER